MPVAVLPTAKSLSAFSLKPQSDRLLEAGVNEPRRATLEVVRQAFERACVEFIDENGGGPGVRLREPPQGKQRK